jgi:hypothetical protein
MVAEDELDRGEVDTEALGVGQPYIAVGTDVEQCRCTVARVRAVTSTESPWQARHR